MGSVVCGQGDDFEGDCRSLWGGDGIQGIFRRDRICRFGGEVRKSYSLWGRDGGGG